MKRPSSSLAITGALLVAVTLSACSSSAEPTTTSTTATSPSEAPSATPAPSATAIAEPVVLQGAATAEVTDRLLIKNGVDLPWDMAWADDGTMLVTMRDEARILRVGLGESDYLVGEGADWLKANVDTTGEGGLLGIALLPSNSSVVYLYVTRGDGNAVVRMMRFGQTLGAPTDVVTGIPKASNHDGGRIRFGPDNFLYITTGDAGNRALSQDLASLAGKILRVVADGTEADGTVPADNPFGTLVWSYGHRNPQGLDWAADGRMFAAELGQNTLDELNVIEPGNNYGWPIKEAMVGAPAGTAAGATVDGYTYPVAWWPTSEASPSGITVTDEAVYVAALRGQRVWRVPLTPDGVGAAHVLLSDLGRIRLVQEGPDGYLYILTSNTAGGDQPVGVDTITRVIVREVEE